MRSLLTAILMLSSIAACAHGRPDSQTSVVVESGPCLDSSNHAANNISIFNDTRRPVTFPVSGASGPPYDLHPCAFAVTTADEIPTDPVRWNLILEHFAPPHQNVRLDAGDRIEFSAYANPWPKSDYPGMVKLRVRDTHRRYYESAPMPVCAPGSALLNPFKPMPLRDPV